MFVFFGGLGVLNRIWKIFGKGNEFYFGENDGLEI